MSDQIRELAEEGLNYFYETGDAGDRSYVWAIRELLNCRHHPAPVVFSDEVGEHIDRLERIGNELRQRCKNKGIHCEICDNQRKTITAAQDALRANPQPGAVVGESFSVGDRVIWRSRFGDEFGAEILHVSTTKYTIKLDDGCYVEKVDSDDITLTNTDKGVV